MPIDSDILFGLAQKQQMGPWTIKIGDKTYAADSVSVHYSEVPVTKPTTRGGVYFSDKMAFKIKIKTSNLEITKVLSKTMLGPNQDFEKIQILTSLAGSNKKLVIVANLTNYAQKRSGLELNLVVIDTELSN
jgi:hypothetical protein